MTKRNRELSHDHNRVVFWFQYNEYKKDTYFWEFFIMYRKVLIISITTLSNNISTSVQALTVFILLNLSLFVHVNLGPYISNELNNMELKALATSAITLYCGLYYLTQGINSVLQVFLFILILLGNISFFYIGLIG